MTKCPTCGSTVALNDGKSVTRCFIPQDELLKEAIEIFEFYADDYFWRKNYADASLAKEFLEKVNHE